MPNMNPPRFREETLRHWAALAVTALVVLAIYWPALYYPFVQDDWCNLSALEHRSALANLREEFDPAGKVYYRPLGMVFFLAIHGLSGLAAWPVHLAELGLLVLNAALLGSLTRRMGYGCLAAWAAMILFASAVPIHLDTVLWMSGLFDLAGFAFFLAAFLLFLQGRSVPSAALFLLGLLCKESLALFPLILLLGGLLDEAFPARTLPSALRRLGPHFAVLAVYGVVRSLCLSPLALPEGHPYQVKLFGLHLLKNAARYAQWSLEAISPFRDLGVAGASGLVVAGLLLSGLAGWGRAEDRRGCWRRCAFLAGWYALALLPVLFLVDHRYRYFLIYSLPALILFLLEVARRIASRLQWRPQAVRIVVAAVLAVNVITAVAYFREKDGRGLEDPYTPGTNHLVHRAYAVRIVCEYLARAHLAVTPGAVFVIGGVDLESFDGAWMFRVLYRDLTIQAFREREIRRDSAGAYSETSGAESSKAAYPGKLRLDPAKTIWLEVREGRVTEQAIEGRGTATNVDEAQ